MTAIGVDRAAARTPITARPRAPRVVRVALAGCGTVGASLVGLIQRQRGLFETRHGVRFELVSVLVRDPEKERGVAVSRQLFTTSVDEFLSVDVDVVVEAIGGFDPAERVVRGAIAAGRHVVTANKALIATHGPELQRLADAQQGALQFEAAVGGGVPVVRTLRSELGGHGVRTITGILNGTTNFLLTALADGVRYADALVDAQARGFAEADPSRDLQGLDAADKIRILAWLAWGVDPAAQEVLVEPLPSDPEPLARQAKRRGGVLKYLAGAVRSDDGRVRAWVRPVIIPTDHPFASVRDEENAVHIDSDSLGVLRLQGRGAGGNATASAVLGDLIEVARGLRYGEI
ncbi:MAG: homoserine dehydrogenase [Gemmatimonadetes bacterium]|nr:homoserine dehydrogenase [Gemmatimonadota bacterium]